MKRILLIISFLISVTNLNAQETVWDQGVPFSLDDKYIVELTDKLDLNRVRDSKSSELTAEEKSICLEIGLAFYSRREYEAANWYFNKSVSSNVRPIESEVSATKEKVFLVKEIYVPITEEKKQDEKEISEMQKDLKFLDGLPKSIDKLSKNDLVNLKKEIQNQIDKLITQRDSLIKINASQEIIDSKDETIGALKKESEMIDLTITNEDLGVENKDLQIQKKELRKYLFWSTIGLILLTLFIIAILQRKTIKVKDTEIDKQLTDINKKNKYLEYSARIIRHDMHSGINTYIPRGLSSLEKRITEEDIEKLKISSSIKMIRDGLSHTQKVYKRVYEFTNLVKQQVVLDKKEWDITTLLKDYFKSTSYKNQIEINNLTSLEVNDTLFCNAIDNLVKNGLQYNDSETKLVKIYLEQENLIIEDNGTGMSQKEFETITGKYLNKEGESEVGLGLIISKTILEEHGFTISCEKINKGTKIKIKTK